jgi:MSHA pilin protein MshC
MKALLAGNRSNDQHGFTLVELVVTLIIVGILAATVAPRFLGTHGFEERGFYDETIAALRYAQKSAISQRRLVCATFVAKSVTLTVGTSFAATTCGNSLIGPNGVAPYAIDSTASATDPKYRNTDIQFASVTFGGVAQTLPAVLTFSPSGRPSSAASITLNNFATVITVEAETGYVH